jgi:DNA-binding transcriptional ArsR family regulator
MTLKVTKSIEEMFCSKTRIKIMKLLDELGQLNVSDTAHRLHINYQETIRQLHILEDSKIVESRLCGRTRFFRFCRSKQALAVQKGFRNMTKRDDA